MNCGNTKLTLTMAAALLSIVAIARADDLVITSFSGNGEVTWTFPTNGVREYRIEWCSDLKQGLWSDLESGLCGMGPTGGTMTVGVPMYYRIKAMGKEPTNMVYVPPGWFEMGNCMDAGEGETRELPIHRVFVSGFYMDKYEITKALWDQVYVWATNNGYAFSNSGSGVATNHPVHTVDWYDCVKWANARSEMEGLTPCYYISPATTTVYRTGNEHLTNSCVRWLANGYRLPTEAEWEKAARGGASGHRFSWADDKISHNRANYRGDAPSYTYDLSIGFHPDYSGGAPPYTSPVEEFTSNGYGLYDMAGNLAEWCWDYLDSSYYGSCPQANPRGPNKEGPDHRICRGGAWVNYANDCRASSRIGGVPNATAYNQGFRLVRTAQ